MKRTFGIRRLETVGQGLPFALGEGLDKAQGLSKPPKKGISYYPRWERKEEETHVFAADGLDHVIGRRAQQLGDDGKLVDMIFTGEKRLAVEHLCENTAGAPDVDLDVVFLPCEHDLGGAIVSGRDVAGHLRVLDPGQTKIANFEIAVFVNQDIAGFKIAMHDTSRVHIFQTSLWPVRLGIEPHCFLGLFERTRI